MVTFGGYGFFNDGAGADNWDFNYDGASGEDFAAILDLQNIDFGTFHLYTDDRRVRRLRPELASVFNRVMG